MLKQFTNWVKKLGIKMNFKDQGIDEQEWKKYTHELALLTYEDQCSPANPRLPNGSRHGRNR